MADNDMSFRQRAVIEFVVKEEIPAAEIHQRLQRAYGSVCMGASSVRRWVKHLKMGKRRQLRKQCVCVFGWLERSSTAGGIFKLPERWQKCVQSSGDYVKK